MIVPAEPVPQPMSDAIYVNTANSISPISLHVFGANDGLAGNPQDANGKDQLTKFLKANGDRVDIVAVQRSPFPKNMQNLWTRATTPRRSNHSNWQMARRLPFRCIR